MNCKYIKSMGIKDFFKKIGRGFKKAGRWIKERALPFVGRIAKPILNVMSMIPGKIGAIGQIGSAVTNVLHNITEKIPNKDARDKISNVIDKTNSTFQSILDKGKGYAETANKVVDTGKAMIGAAKDGFNNIVKPAVMPKQLNPM